MSRQQRTTADGLLLGEWACLGALAQAPAHGFAVAQRLTPTGDLGAVWSLSRALTYRALDRLVVFGLVAEQRVERGRAGGQRLVLAITPAGRQQLDAWLDEAVVHLRDLRSELLLKLVIGRSLRHPPDRLVAAQRQRLSTLKAALSAPTRDRHADPVVDAWRHEVAEAAERFLETALTHRSLQTD
jgi:DNA-binding PadR family transcriptional regulator